MTERKTPRNKDEGFVGVVLTPTLLKKLDARVAKENKLDKSNRSQVIRLALIDYLK